MLPNKLKFLCLTTLGNYNKFTRHVLNTLFHRTYFILPFRFEHNYVIIVVFLVWNSKYRTTIRFSDFSTGLCHARRGRIIFVKFYPNRLFKAINNRMMRGWVVRQQQLKCSKIRYCIYSARSLIRMGDKSNRPVYVTHCRNRTGHLHLYTVTPLRHSFSRYAR